MTATPASAGERVGGQSPTVITTPAKAGSSWGTLLTKGSTGYCNLPNWTPAFAGVVLGMGEVGPLDDRDPGPLARCRANSARPPRSCPRTHRTSGVRHDDRRRSTAVAVTLALIRSPAEAGAQDSSSAADHGPLTPASAGERAGGHPLTVITTPAKAGVQLGDVANDAQHPVTATSPTGPRPSPGW